MIPAIVCLLVGFSAGVMYMYGVMRFWMRFLGIWDDFKTLIHDMRMKRKAER